ncbi:MAG: hypothetical protein V4671_25045 [Armatimonadota bacterium]
MTDTFKARAAEALIENEQTPPTLEDLYIRTLLLLKSLQAPPIRATLSPAQAQKSTDYLKELLLDFEQRIEETGDDNAGFVTPPAAG